MTTTTNPALRSATLAVALAAAALAGCDATTEPAMPETGEQSDELLVLNDRVRRLTELEALRGLPGCYGVGHDLIYTDVGGAHAAALDVLRRCHADDLITNVYLFDETKAAQRLTSLDQLVGFIDTFATQQGYSGARNVPGNAQIEITGPSSAVIRSSTHAPHFITRGVTATADRPTLDLIQARYVQTAARDRDGTWRVVELDLIVQQIWRGEGGYPFAAQ